MQFRFNIHFKTGEVDSSTRWYEERYDKLELELKNQKGYAKWWRDEAERLSVAAAETVKS